MERDPEEKDGGKEQKERERMERGEIIKGIEKEGAWMDGLEKERKLEEEHTEWREEKSKRE